MKTQIKRYTKKDIEDFLETYVSRPLYKIKISPEKDKIGKIIDKWFCCEDVNLISKTSGKTTTEVVNILKNTGLY